MSAYWVLMIICFSHSYMFGTWIALQGLSKSNTWLLVSGLVLFFAPWFTS